MVRHGTLAPPPLGSTPAAGRGAASWLVALALLGGCAAAGGDGGPEADGADAVEGDAADAAVDDDGACIPRCPPAEGEVVPGCGSDGCGGYCSVCGLKLPDGGFEQWWWLCDESRRRCTVPEEDCAGGWCRIPARSFRMGIAEYTFTFTWPPHPVTLTRAFEIMAAEVTQARWEEVMGHNPTPQPHCGPDCPANGMTWFDAVEYANRESLRAGLPTCYELVGCAVAAGERLDCELARFAGPDCPGYRLPSAAEWELAAGAGAASCYPNGHYIPFQPDCWSPTAEDAGWFCGNAEAAYGDCVYEDCSTSDPENGVRCCGPQPVGQKVPNRFGLYDTVGNVWEYTGTLMRKAPDPDAAADASKGYVGTPRVDPGFDEELRRTTEGAGWDKFVVAKGGCFDSSYVWSCSAARRGALIGWPEDFFISEAGRTGLRLVRTLGPGERPGAAARGRASTAGP